MGVWLLLSCGPRDPVPAELRAIREGVEEAFERALVPDAGAVADRAGKIDEAWSGFRPAAEEDGAAAEVLDGMDGAVALLGLNAESSVDSVVLGRACNGVAAWLDDLYAVYAPPAPTELLTVAYHARAVWMDARNGDIPGQAASDLEAERAAWDAVSAQVVSLGYTTQALAVDAALDDQDAALADQDTGALQLASGEAVDAAAAVEAAYR